MPSGGRRGVSRVLSGDPRGPIKLKKLPKPAAQCRSNPVWEWVVHLDADKTKTGLSYSRESAIFNAKCAIERALDVSRSRPPAGRA